MGGSRMSFFISIHSLHTEGDSGTLHSATYREDFNPLPPHGGRPVMLASFGFLKPNFNPLPPHGGRRFCPGNGTGTVCISIHSLHTEGDQKYHILPSKNQLFQSTPSTRRETKLICRTHQRSSYFNPLPPHGGRLCGLFLTF